MKMKPATGVLFSILTLGACKKQSRDHIEPAANTNSPPSSEQTSPKNNAKKAAAVRVYKSLTEAIDTFGLDLSEPSRQANLSLSYTFNNHDDGDKLYSRHVTLESEVLQSWPKDFTGMQLKFVMPKDADKNDLSATLTCKDRNCDSFTSTLTLTEGDLAGTAKVEQTRYKSKGGSTLNWMLNSNQEEAVRRLEKLVDPLKEVIAAPALAEDNIDTRIDIRSIEGGNMFFEIMRSIDFGTQSVVLHNGLKAVVIGASAQGKLNAEDLIRVDEWIVLEGRTASVGGSSALKAKASFSMSGLLPDNEPLEQDAPTLTIEPASGGTAGVSFKR